jgi:hypothetical protein
MSTLVVNQPSWLNGEDADVVCNMNNEWADLYRY